MLAPVSLSQHQIVWRPQPVNIHYWLCCNAIVKHHVIPQCTATCFSLDRLVGDFEEVDTADFPVDAASATLALADVSLATVFGRCAPVWVVFVDGGLDVDDCCWSEPGPAAALLGAVDDRNEEGCFFEGVTEINKTVKK